MERHSSLMSVAQMLAKIITLMTETYVHEDFSQDEIFFPRYSVFRSDRNSRTSVKSRGGGVFIACLNKLKATLIKENDDSIKQIFILIEIDTKISSLVVLTSFLAPMLTNMKHILELLKIFVKIMPHQTLLCLATIIFQRSIGRLVNTRLVSAVLLAETFVNVLFVLLVEMSSWICFLQIF